MSQVGVEVTLKLRNKNKARVHVNVKNDKKTILSCMAFYLPANKPLIFITSSGCVGYS